MKPSPSHGRPSIALVAALSLSCAATRSTPAQGPTGTAPVAELSARASGTRCAARGPLPDAQCTPGAVMTTDFETICNTSTHGRRLVTATVHRQAFTEYGYSYPQAPGAFEVDHLIPLELGGDNVIENLWAEPAEPRPGFHEKDKVENYLHKQVCSHSMSLADAQHQIATDWMAVWNRISSMELTDTTDDDGETE